MYAFPLTVAPAREPEGLRFAAELTCTGGVFPSWALAGAAAGASVAARISARAAARACRCQGMAGEAFDVNVVSSGGSAGTGAHRVVRGRGPWAVRAHYRTAAEARQSFHCPSHRHCV